MPNVAPSTLDAPFQLTRENRQGPVERGGVGARRVLGPEEWPARRRQRQRATDGHPTSWSIVIEEGDPDGTRRDGPALQQRLDPLRDVGPQPLSPGESADPRPHFRSPSAECARSSLRSPASSVNTMT
jgi:hypothetical protein